MQLNQALARLHADKDYKKWHAQHSEHYLAHGFVMHDKGVAQPWQIGFYDPASKQITVFVVDEQVHQNPPSDAFSDSSHVRELSDPEHLAGSDAALAAAEAHRAEHFKGHEPIKTIQLLQHLERGELWNISFVTDKFTICNIKLDAKSLAVLSATCESLLSWAPTAHKGITR